MRFILDLILERGDYSWSVENVSTMQTRALLEEYTSRFPDKVGWATLDACDFGAPTSRVRVWAGPPALIHALQSMPATRRVSVYDAFMHLSMPIPAPRIKNQTKGRSGKPCTRSIHEPSHTICAR